MQPKSYLVQEVAREISHYFSIYSRKVMILGFDIVNRNSKVGWPDRVG